MRSIIVEVSREIEQFAFEIRRRPEEGAIQEFTPDRADESFHKAMRQRDIRYGFDFVDLEDAKIGLTICPTATLKMLDSSITCFSARARLCRQEIPVWIDSFHLMPLGRTGATAIGYALGAA